MLEVGPSHFCVRGRQVERARMIVICELGAVTLVREEEKICKVKIGIHRGNIR